MLGGNPIGGICIPCMFGGGPPHPGILGIFDGSPGFILGGIPIGGIIPIGGMGGGRTGGIPIGW